MLRPGARREPGGRGSETFWCRYLSVVQVASVLWRLGSFILLCLGQGREMSLLMITYRD